jgi:hypothetical protein
MRHHLIVSAIDSILVIKRHWQVDDGSFGSTAPVLRRPRHVGFTPNSGRIAALPRTVETGHNRTHAVQQTEQA